MMGKITANANRVRDEDVKKIVTIYRYYNIVIDRLYNNYYNRPAAGFVERHYYYFVARARVRRPIVSINELQL